MSNGEAGAGTGGADVADSTPPVTQIDLSETPAIIEGRVPSQADTGGVQPYSVQALSPCPEGT